LVSGSTGFLRRQADRKIRTEVATKEQRLPFEAMTELITLDTQELQKLADDVASNDGLAAEARTRGQAPGRIEAIRFIVLHLAEMLFPFTDDHMTGRAGAAAAARVLERDAQVLGDVEKRLGLAVVRIRQLAMLELHGLCLAVNNECNFWHFSRA
jgi:hypothetical protein